MKYISIDVATKSLAIGVYNLGNFNINIDMSDAKNANNLMNSMIDIVSMDVYDITNGGNAKDSSIDTKAGNLKKILTKYDHIEDTAIVLIEYQMNANHMSNAIFNMLVYHFSGKHKIEIVKPAHKNSIYFHPQFTIQSFLSKYGSNYKANKEHTKHNMLLMLAALGRLDAIKHLKKSNYDDIADTFMQCIWFHKNH